MKKIDDQNKNLRITTEHRSLQRQRVRKKRTTGFYTFLNTYTLIIINLTLYTIIIISKFSILNLTL